VNDSTDNGRRAKVALVTGASFGIGEEFAKQLAAKDYSLVLVARSADRLREIGASLTSEHGVTVEVLPADLTTTEGRDAVVARLSADPPVDLLVNNAGYGQVGLFAESDPAEIEGQVQLNVIALVALARAALPGMVARRRGGIINVSSVAGFFPGPNTAIYSATKAFVNSFSESLSVEVQGTGVRIQSLCPGFTRTGFQARAGGEPSRLPDAAWLESPEVVAESLTALNHGALFCVPGIAYKTLTLTGGMLPRPLVRWISGLYGRQMR
jgi:short-subunit dehydrogenase